MNNGGPDDMFKFRRNYNLLHLMVYYALLITAVIGLFVIFMSTTTTRDDNQGINNSLVNGMDKVTDLVTANEREVREVGQRLTGTSGQIKNLYKYFQLNPAQYLTYSQTHMRYNIFYYLPAESSQVFAGNSAIKKLMITTSDSKASFVGTQEKPGGYRATKPLDLENQFSFSYTFINSANLNSYGSLYLVYETKAVTRALRHIAHAKGLQLMVLSETGSPMYRYRGKGVKKAELNRTTRLVQQTLVSQSKSRQQLKREFRYRTVKLENGDQIVALTSRAYVRRQQLQRNLILLLEASAIDLVLVVGLWITFRRYRNRFSRMIKSMNQVSQGDLDVRLTVPEQAGDLHVLATRVNQMLDDINRYIYQIYHLQLEQKDANMKALQSQIQPHFLYNTLEYIRMYAVAEDEPELAEVVYAFAALLRNNTDQSPTTTLEKEAGFTEKYIYLYQMRFPDQIAYGFQIEPDLAQLQIPKFILQPIVENYFAHGIDYVRDDNVIDIKAWTDERQFVHLLVRDNGKGMTDQQLTAVRAQINNQVDASQRQQNIGMRNVLERLQGYFGDSARLTIAADALGGIAVEMVFLKRVD